MTDQQVNYANLVELTKHNRATEAQAKNDLKELTRHNNTTEATAWENLAELRRHQLATESETQRSNLANEAIKRLGNEYGLTQAQISAAGRIQAAGLNANAALAVASLNADTNKVIATLNNMNQKEIAELNNSTNSFISILHNQIEWDKQSLAWARLNWDKSSMKWQMLFGKDGLLRNLPGDISNALNFDYLGKAAGKAIGGAN